MSEQPMNRLQFDSKIPTGFSNNQAKGKLPNPLPEPLFLNLGCGDDIREGFVNIDLYSDNPKVVYMDIRKLQLPDNSVSLILANDILEHFSHREIDLILKEWNRVLIPGKEIIIRVPSLKLQAKAYLEGKWDADIASYMIFGGQTNPGDYHFNAFDIESIKKHLVNTGFEILEIQEYDLPQDKGFINLNMAVKAVKKNTESIKEPGLFEDLDFDTPEVSKSDDNITSIEATQQVDSDFNQDDISLLAELAEVDKEDDNKIISKEIKEKLNIVWEGSQFVHHSLALINREHSYNILKTGLANLTIVPYEDETFEPNSQKLEILKENDIRYKEDVDDYIARLPYVWIRHQWPPKADPPKGAKWIIMQPWEYSKLRKDFVEIFNSADEVWTPSLFSRNSFINSGVESDKVQIIPNGIDPNLFKPFGPKYDLKTEKSLKLLYVGGTTWRKGFDILLDSYSTLFNSKADITLVVKDMGVGTFYNGQTSEDKIREIQNNPEKPEIIYINEELNEDEMAALYRACDILVSPYRGEGFSLPTLEALASGLPVIVTKDGATEDFTNENFAIYIDSKEINIGNEIDGYELAGEATVLEPDKEHLMKIFKTIYERPNMIYSMGIIAQSFARTKMTWHKSTLKILSRLDYLYRLQLSKSAKDVLADEEDEYIRFGRAEELFNDNKFNDAKKIYDSLKIDAFEDQHKLMIYTRIIDLNMAFSDFETAKSFINIAEKTDKHSPDIVYLKSMLEFRKGNKTEALELLTPLMKKWIDIKHQSYAGINLDDLLVLTADILLDDDDLDGANQLYTEALKYNTENPFACYGAGLCFKEAGAANEAKQMFEWALKISPDFKEAQDELDSLK